MIYEISFIINLYLELLILIWCLNIWCGRICDLNRKNQTRSNRTTELDHDTTLAYGRRLERWRAMPGHAGSRDHWAAHTYMIHCTKAVSFPLSSRPKLFVEATLLTEAQVSAFMTMLLGRQQTVSQAHHSLSCHSPQTPLICSLSFFFLFTKN